MEIYTIREFCEILGCSRQMLEYYCQRGLIEKKKSPLGKPYFTSEDAERLKLDIELSKKGVKRGKQKNV